MRRILQLLLLISLSGIASAGVFSWIGCMLYECCDAPYIKPDFQNLTKQMSEQVFGQHIALEAVVDDLKQHFARPHSKPLVLSFNGETGTGKNHVSMLIAESIYKYGLGSAHVHHIDGLSYHDESKINENKVKLYTKVRSAVASCGRAMFIFDEVDHMPKGLITVLKSFLGHNSRVDDVDFRSAIFIFLSNAGGRAIAAATAAHRPKPRTRLTADHFEKIVSEELYQTEGGMKMSELIANQAIDHFIPFLPLEREHVRKCIEAYVLKHHPEASKNTALEDVILDGLIYDPPFFCSSGCKKLELRIDVEVAKWKKRTKSHRNEL